MEGGWRCSRTEVSTRHREEELPGTLQGVVEATWEEPRTQKAWCRDQGPLEVSTCSLVLAAFQDAGSFPGGIRPPHMESPCPRALERAVHSGPPVAPAGPGDGRESRGGGPPSFPLDRTPEHPRAGASGAVQPPGGA